MKTKNLLVDDNWWNNMFIVNRRVIFKITMDYPFYTLYCNLGNTYERHGNFKWIKDARQKAQELLDEFLEGIIENNNMPSSVVETHRVL